MRTRIQELMSGEAAMQEIHNGKRLYEGPKGYVTLTRTLHAGREGALLYYANPDPRKLHAIDSDGMTEMYEAVAALETELGATTGPESIPAVVPLEFLVLYGAYDPLHAGADVTQFAGDPDYDMLREHMYRGVRLDTRIKQLWPLLRTVGVFCGSRFGGSVEWPLFARYGVADTATVVQFTEVQLGIVPGWNGILNAMLKSNPSNAQYMSTTGNPVQAEEMQRVGLIQSLVQNPPAPDRRLTPPDEWPAQWSAHADQCQQRLLEAAIDLAAGAQGYPLGSEEQLVDAEAYFAEIGRRTQDTEYRELHDRVAAQVALLGPNPSTEQLKPVTKTALEELALLGKPLAPIAVNFATRFVKQYGLLSREDLLARFDEIGHVEADLCIELMHHRHRRIGVNAVLTRDPAERIPVFAEVNYSERGTEFP